jgi:hypothetical protein
MSNGHHSLIKRKGEDSNSKQESALRRSVASSQREWEGLKGTFLWSSLLSSLRSAVSSQWECLKGTFLWSSLLSSLPSLRSAVSLLPFLPFGQPLPFLPFVQRSASISLPFVQRSAANGNALRAHSCGPFPSFPCI